MLARVRAEVSARTIPSSVRDELLACEAAVLFRLEDAAAANALVARLRELNPVRAHALAKRRLLRSYIR